MNRRKFIKTLAILGAGTSVPLMAHGKMSDADAYLSWFNKPLYPYQKELFERLRSMKPPGKMVVLKTRMHGKCVWESEMMLQRLHDMGAPKIRGRGEERPSLIICGDIQNT